MSDREFCRDCKHFTAIKLNSGHQAFMCNYPVPHWALPNQLVEWDTMVTCPTYQLSFVQEIQSILPTPTTPTTPRTLS